MAGRKEEFLPDGKRRRVTRDDVAEAWSSARIPAAYAIGTAIHESSLTLNEQDTEPDGFQSFGIYQLSDEECTKAKSSTGKVILSTVTGDKKAQRAAELGVLSEASRVLSYVAELRLTELLKTAGLTLEQATPDVWAYLALAHNEGLGATEKSIKTYGLDWGDYKARNPGAAILKYGDDCIGGGSILDDKKKLLDGATVAGAVLLGLGVAGGLYWLASGGAEKVAS